MTSFLKFIFMLPLIALALPLLFVASIIVTFIFYFLVIFSGATITFGVLYILEYL